MTLGEFSDVLREIFGEHRDPAPVQVLGERREYDEDQQRGEGVLGGEQRAAARGGRGIQHEAIGAR